MFYNNKIPVILTNVVKYLHIKQKYLIISRNVQVPERGDPSEANKINSG